ncbi:MAG: hypothetical protein AMJ63_08025 [Myxococcales bacterium SG8_38_1]|jgi:MscS family membrane protein|nr:MAG: hypothetical protein AMJ63_08025 [Myxococcales bacterium SG8_38_1]
MPTLVTGLALVMLGSGAHHSADAQPVEHPLEPAVTSSPRETLRTFVDSSESKWGVVRDEGEGQRTKEGLQKLLALDARIKGTLDLSEVAPEARSATADDVSVYLYEVLSRIQRPPIEEIPGNDDLENGAGLESWTLPHTEIRIHRVAKGPHAGEFLFDPETVDRAKEFYERTRHLPYREAPPIENVSSFLEVYGGWNLPITWVDALPGPMRTVAWGQAIWKWVGLLGSLLLALVLIAVFFRITRRHGKAREGRRYLSRLAVPVLLFAVAAFSIPWLAEEILLSGDVARWVKLSSTAVAYLSLAWVLWIVILTIGERIVSSPRIQTEGLDASLIRLTARLIAIAVVVVLVFQGATAIGIPLMGLVASVSIGGLAVALAAQDTLKSVLGSLTIFIDQPYRVGERIIAGGYDGVVERIGLRSTGIRQLDGNVTSIPNEKMAAMEIENVDRRQNIRRKTRLRMAAGSSEAQVREALAIVREIVEDHEGMSADRPPRVYFDEFNPDSLSIVIFYWYEPADYWAFCELAERINLEIVRRFGEAGIELAPPTSTMRISADPKRGDPLEHPE